MAIDQVRKSRSITDSSGKTLIDLDEKDVIPVIDPMERVTFARMHEIAQRRGISLVCKRCDSAITGQNNDTSGVMSVSCCCREFRFVR